jgi:hypothetical protein
VAIGISCLQPAIEEAAVMDVLLHRQDRHDHRGPPCRNLLADQLRRVEFIPFDPAQRYSLGRYDARPGSYFSHLTLDAMHGPGSKVEQLCDPQNTRPLAQLTLRLAFDFAGAASRALRPV